MKELENEGFNKFMILECILQEDNKFSFENMTAEEKDKQLSEIKIYKNILLSELNQVMKFDGDFCVSPGMYTKLFNEITDIKNELYTLSKRIEDVQIETEEMYLRGESIL